MFAKEAQQQQQKRTASCAKSTNPIANSCRIGDLLKILFLKFTTQVWYQNKLYNVRGVNL